jgi:hypothetical protein
MYNKYSRLTEIHRQQPPVRASTKTLVRSREGRSSDSMLRRHLHPDDPCTARRFPRVVPTLRVAALRRSSPSEPEMAAGSSTSAGEGIHPPFPFNSPLYVHTRITCTQTQ